MEMQVLNLLLCFIECFSVNIFMYKMFTSRFSSCIPMILSAIVNSVLIYSIPNFSPIKATICVASVFLISILLYSTQSYIKLAFSVTLIYAFYIVDVVIGNILSVALDKQFLDVFYSDFLTRIIISLSVKLLNIVIMMLIYKVFKKSGINLEKRVWILFNIVMIVFLSVTVSYMVIYPTTVQNNESSLLYMIISLSFLIMSIIVIYFFTSICASFKQKEKLYLLQTAHDSIEEKLAIQKQNSDKLHKIRHDMRNHLINLKMLIESNDIENADSLLKDVIGQTDRISLSITQTTGDSIIDTIIAYKATVCENKNIAFNYELSELPEIKIDHADISSVISNLLDNAIEATEKTSDPAINLKVFYHGKYINIFSKNTCKRSDEKSLATTKKNPEMHGYGTQIIKELANKYDGNFAWKKTESHFTANVLMKNN